MDLTNTIKQFILKKIVNSREKIAIKDTESLIETGIIDSLAIMKLLVFLEEEFTIHVTNNDLMPENFESIEAIASLVENKLKN